MKNTKHKNHPSLRSVNLNLLPILASLLATRSVSNSAERLNMSQSAVSDALARLRFQFRDELLVRSGRELRVTPFAEELIAPVNHIVERIEDLVERPPLDLASLEREFVIATADPVVLQLGASIFRFLQEQAPNCSVRFVDIQRHDYQRLKDLELDLVIVPRGFLRKEKLFEVAIYTESFVCIARKGHPDIGKRLTKENYECLPHASYRSDQSALTGMEARLTELSQLDVVKVPNFAMLPIIVEQSDAIAFVQRNVAERFAAHSDIQIFELPLPMAPLEVCMYWGIGHDSDPAHSWFRRSLEKLADQES